MAFNRRRTVDDLWGYCHGCYYAETCLAGCTWTAHALMGRAGNNPMCHHRALDFASKGLRERLVKVKDANGEPQMWALEATSRTALQRIGVTLDYVKPGDTVKARCHHLRDGSNGCLLGFLKAKDGTVKDWDGNNAPPPPDF